MRYLILATLLAAASPALSQNMFYAPTNVAVETNGSAEIRIIRAPGSDNGQPSSFHIGTSDFSMDATAIWPADYPTPVDQTVTIQPGQNFAYVTIPLTYHNSFQDTKVIALRIEPMANSAIDRANPTLVVYDGDKFRWDVWKPSTGPITIGGYAMLKVDSDGFPKLDGATFPKPNYMNVYPYGVAGEVFRVTNSGYTPDGLHKTWHVVKFNETSRDAWFYEDDLQAVTPAQTLGDPNYSK